MQNKLEIFTSEESRRRKIGSQVKITQENGTQSENYAGLLIILFFIEISSPDFLENSR